MSNSAGYHRVNVVMISREGLTALHALNVFPLIDRHTAPEKFYIEACDDGAGDVLAIDRVSTEMTLTGAEEELRG